MDCRRLEVRHGLALGAALEPHDLEARLHHLVGGERAGQADSDRNSVNRLQACCHGQPPRFQFVSAVIASEAKQSRTGVRTQIEIASALRFSQ
jgi:hypothetical protein